MVEDKEIDIAARAQVLSKHFNETAYFQLRSIEDFTDGAHWAINEFIKNLWHPASEKPNIKQGECCVTCLVKFKNGSTELCVYFRNLERWVCDDMSPKDFKRNFKGWLYIDDLLPKEGGEQ